MERDVLGKFALKNFDYREVHSLRLTNDTWKELGIISECLGLTRSDYLEKITRSDFLPCITREEFDVHSSHTLDISESQPCITRYEQEIKSLKAQVQHLQTQNLELKERSAINFVYDVVDFEAIRDRILFELKLGRQASIYKTSQKALNRFIQDIKLMVDSF